MRRQLGHSFRLALLLTLISAGIGRQSLSAAEPRVVAGQIGGHPLEGLELLATPERHILLGQDGWIHDFDPRVTPSELAVRTGRFTPLTSVQLRQQLQGEFGPEFEVKATARFIVVQPLGTGDRWPAMFERLHRMFVTYFSLRGSRIREGNFPMVAVVFPNEGAMQQHLRELEIQAPGVLGLYDAASNRIVMYDHSDAYGQLASTICHEAAHQSAFNSGIHSRVTEAPHWVVEGIGCMFQGPSFLSGRVGGSLAERCDPQLLETYREIYAGDGARVKRDLESLIVSDALFRDPETTRAAYALSWAVTVYLAERRGSELAALLEHFGQRPPFTPYPPAERRADFDRLTSTPPEILARQLDRFINQL